MIALVGKQITYSAQIIVFWKRGLNTHDIAARLCLPEHVIANALARARDHERSR